MSLFMVGLGVALMVMIFGIALAMSKDMMDLIDFGYASNDHKNASRHGDSPALEKVGS